MTDKTFEYIKQAEEFGKRFPAPTLPEGFIRHDGGECPVPMDSCPALLFRDGRGYSYHDLHARTWPGWRHCGYPGDIIAYRPANRLARPAEKAEKALLTVQNAAKTLAAAQGAELEHRRQNSTYDHRLRAEHESLIERDAIMTEELATLRAKAEKLAAALSAMDAVAENCHFESGICCCGDIMFDHSSPMNCGHSPVDSGSYHMSLVVKDARAALAEWEGKP